MLVFFLFFVFSSLNNSFYLTNQQLLSFFFCFSTDYMALLFVYYSGTYCLEVVSVTGVIQHTHTHPWFQQNGHAKKSHMSGEFSLLFHFCCKIVRFPQRKNCCFCFFVYCFLNLPTSLYTLLQRSCCVFNEKYLLRHSFFVNWGIKLFCFLNKIIGLYLFFSPSLQLLSQPVCHLLQSAPHPQCGRILSLHRLNTTHGLQSEVSVWPLRLLNIRIYSTV